MRVIIPENHPFFKSVEMLRGVPVFASEFVNYELVLCGDGVPRAEKIVDPQTGRVLGLLPFGGSWFELRPKLSRMGAMF